MRPPRALPFYRAAVVVGCVAVIGGALTAVSTAVSAAHAPAGLASQVAASSSASTTVYWRGNGHGHGLSQYGAHGAAMRGLSTKQILAFYYPGATPTTVAPSTIRVELSEATTATTVFAGTTGLRLSGYGTLPAKGYSQFRLVPAGSGLRLDARKAGGAATWAVLARNLPARADFSSSAGWVQVLLDDGSSTRYRGTVGAVRSGSSELTINRLPLDLYVQGSVPREMPISWEPAAVHAQAVAARSYAEAVRAYSSGSAYDICDTPSCQVYGGMAHYDSAGNLQWSDAPQAIEGNANLVLRYGGQPVFAQYSASNGGATVDGGRPYLIGRSDPYDSTASGDPYLDESTEVSTSSIADALGLRSFTSISGVQRDGFGPWGGRVVSAKVTGTDSSGRARTVTVDGFDLGAAMGVYTDYLRFDAAPVLPSAPASVRAKARDAGAQISWSPPATSGGAAVTGYEIRLGAATRRVPATTRSTWVGPLSNFTARTVSVRALTSVGTGPAATVAAKGVATARSVVVLPPARIIDTRMTKTFIDAAHPYRVAVPGLGAVPRKGATSVQLSVTVFDPTASGVLRVAPVGIGVRASSAVAYVAGHTITATVSVPLQPSGTIEFAPSAGRVRIAADQESYTAATGSRIAVRAPQPVATVRGVPTGNGAVLDLSTLAGITGSTTGVVLAIDAQGPRRASLAIWPDGTQRPDVRAVTVTPNAPGTNTIIVPLNSTRRLRIVAAAGGVVAGVRLVGVLGSTGGGLVSFPVSYLADGAASQTVGTTAVSLPVLGVNQIPSSGAAAVLVHVTVTSSSAAGQLWAYPSGTGAAAAPVVRFGAAGAATGTALLPVGPDGHVYLRSSVAGTRVAVDAVGYATVR